jgi:ABC-2 type transport system ATP-binding protein
MTTLEITGLTKWYGSIKGIEDVSVALERGEVFGYLGPNGSGKTTTLRYTDGGALLRGWPVRDMAVLGGVMGIATIMGGVVRRRRDLPQ